MNKGGYYSSDFYLRKEDISTIEKELSRLQFRRPYVQGGLATGPRLRNNIVACIAEVVKEQNQHLSIFKHFVQLFDKYNCLETANSKQTRLHKKYNLCRSIDLWLEKVNKNYQDILENTNKQNQAPTKETKMNEQKLAMREQQAQTLMSIITLIGDSNDIDTLKSIDYSLKYDKDNRLEQKDKTKLINIVKQIKKIYDRPGEVKEQTKITTPKVNQDYLKREVDQKQQDYLRKIRKLQKDVEDAKLREASLSSHIQQQNKVKIKVMQQHEKLTKQHDKLVHQLKQGIADVSHNKLNKNPLAIQPAPNKYIQLNSLPKKESLPLKKGNDDEKTALITSNMQLNSQNQKMSDQLQILRVELRERMQNQPKNDETQKDKTIAALSLTENRLRQTVKSTQNSNKMLNEQLAKLRQENSQLKEKAREADKEFHSNDSIVLISEETAAKQRPWQDKKRQERWSNSPRGCIYES